MVPVDTLRELYEYNYWARDRQLEACASLTSEQFLRPLGSSFSSVRDTLSHLLAAEWVWLERWRGRSPQTTADAEPYYKGVLREFAAENFPAVADLQNRWGAVERGVRDYLGGLTENALARPVTYINLKGEKWTYALWRVLFHLINHQSYHRGQVTTLLRQLGASAPQIDFLVAHDVEFRR